MISTMMFFFMTPPQGQGGGGMLGLLMPFILIFVVMYFFMIRPQMKKQKQHQAMLQALQKGDKVLTSGGIYGKIVGVKEKSFLVQIADNTKVEISKTAVAQKVEKSE
ncbi:MAG: preprotein translocase subunit YajC [bacterium]